MREPVLVWALGAAVGVLVILVGILTSWVRRLSRLVRRSTEGSVAHQLEELERAFGALRSDLEEVRTTLAELEERLAGCVQRVGLVRFDAFEDVGGRVSFSLALLDGRGDGVVLSVLNGREAVRAYAKALVGGKPSHPLSEEEREAIAQARDARYLDALR